MKLRLKKKEKVKIKDEKIKTKKKKSDVKIDGWHILEFIIDIIIESIFDL